MSLSVSAYRSPNSRKSKMRSKRRPGVTVRICSNSYGRGLGVSIGKRVPCKRCSGVRAQESIPAEFPRSFRTNYTQRLRQFSSERPAPSSKTSHESLRNVQENMAPRSRPAATTLPGCASVASTAPRRASWHLALAVLEEFHLAQAFFRLRF